MENASALKVKRAKMKLVETKLSTTETHVVHFRDELKVDWIFTVTYQKGKNVEVLPTSYSEQEYKLQTPETRNNLCAFAAESTEKQQIDETKQELLDVLVNLRNHFTTCVSTYQGEMNRHGNHTEIYRNELEKADLIVKKYCPELFP